MFSKPAAIGEPVSTGTVSVQELLHPLEGKALRTILKASGSIANGNSAQGMQQLRSAMRDPNAQPYALSMLAAEHLKRGDYDAAIVELHDAIGLLPGLAANHSNLAFALGVRGRDEEALKEARKALQLDPGRARYRYVIGQILLQMGPPRRGCVPPETSCGGGPQRSGSVREVLRAVVLLP